jgi:hypothetical protein
MLRDRAELEKHEELKDMVLESYEEHKQIKGFEDKFRNSRFGDEPVSAKIEPISCSLLADLRRLSAQSAGRTAR